MFILRKGISRRGISLYRGREAASRACFSAARTAPIAGQKTKIRFHQPGDNADLGDYNRSRFVRRRPYFIVRLWICRRPPTLRYPSRCASPCGTFPTLTPYQSTPNPRNATPPCQIPIPFSSLSLVLVPVLV
jgi:hypothetical protein